MSEQPCPAPNCSGGMVTTLEVEFDREGRAHPVNRTTVCATCGGKGTVSR